MINIVLVEPEIPQNTGNIVRTCAATGATLHIIEPCAFSFEDKYLKRAGLDYWDLATIKKYKNLEEFFEKNKGQYFFASTKSPRNHVEVNYDEDCYVFFGKETKGLPEDLLHDNYDKCIRIPMRKETRSLNLANSVAIVIYEYHRQHGFEGLLEEGHLTKY